MDNKNDFRAQVEKIKYRALAVGTRLYTALVVLSWLLVLLIVLGMFAFVYYWR